MVRVYCKNSGEYKEFVEGTTLWDMLPAFNFEKPLEILAAKVNNVCEGLKFRVFNSRDVEFLDYSTYSGRAVYCRSLCFLLAKACQDVFPRSKVTIRRPISKGYFCNFTKDDGTTGITPADLEKINARMRQIIDSGMPFRRHEVQVNEAMEVFRRIGRDDVVTLLETSGQVYVTYYDLGGTPDIFYEALAPSTSMLKVWELRPYDDGAILRVPNRHKPEELADFHEQPKTFEVFRENIRWNEIMKLSNVGDVNRACQEGRGSELIQVAEALQEKKIVQIAEEIDRRYLKGDLKLVLITGPSSSGKTTVTKRLSTQLKACGLRPISFSTDDYFVNRVETPKLPDGSYDFDNFDTVDHEYLQNDLLKILAGDTVEVPEYNFVTGKREMNGRKLRLDPGSILIIEGIHALNPALTDKVADACKFRIFINAVTSISLDDHNCIPTSDNRLLRRILRDYNKGSFTPSETIANWPNVRRNEVKWIYPFQECADVIFNSAYLIEFAVLRGHAEQILSTVPKNCPQFTDAARILKYLNYFNYVSDKEIPPTSLLREFVGGSSFKY